MSNDLNPVANHKLGFPFLELNLCADQIRTSATTVKNLSYTTRNKGGDSVSCIPILHPIGKKRRLGRIEVAQVAHRRGVEAADAVLGELRDGDGRQDADDRHDDHQLHQGKTFLSFLIHGLQHFSTSVFFVLLLGDRPVTPWAPGAPFLDFLCRPWQLKTSSGAMGSG